MKQETTKEFQPIFEDTISASKKGNYRKRSRRCWRDNSQEISRSVYNLPEKKKKFQMTVLML